MRQETERLERLIERQQIRVGAAMTRDTERATQGLGNRAEELTELLEDTETVRDMWCERAEAAEEQRDALLSAARTMLCAANDTARDIALEDLRAAIRHAEREGQS